MRTASTQATQFANNLRGQLNNALVDPARKAKFEYKDVARIIQGIVISKMFYGTLEQIQRSTDAVWEFTKQLEFAQIAFSNLFNSVDLANEFINVLKDFAAETPFSFIDAEQAAKRLLAYGVEYKNVMYMMEGVLAASAMQGNPIIIERVSRALGQIYTKGRLFGEEMRQLAEAGIPAYAILREKLGITQEQLRNLGREAIPASKAINALVDGMTERFGGVVEASAWTITGLLNKITDNTTMILSAMTKGLTDIIKAQLNVLGTELFRLRDIVDVKGLGGIFEDLIPTALHDSVRLFAANLMNLWGVIRVHGANALALFKSALFSIIVVLNMLLPAVTIVSDIFARFIQVIVNNTLALRILTGALVAGAMAWALFKIHAMAALALTALTTVILGVAKAVMALSIVLAANPIITILIFLTAGFVGLTIATNGANNALTNFFKKLAMFGGHDPDKMLLPESKDRAADIDKFNESLDDTKDSMDEVKKSTDKATNSLLSFDEVYQLPSGSGGLDDALEDIKDIDVGYLADQEFETFMPEVPDFGDFASTFVENLGKSLGDRLKAAAIGATIGAILGGLLGGPLGAAIGALAGAIAGLFWEDLKNYMNLTDAQGLTIPLGAAIGAAIGAVLGGPAGAAIGAIIGLIATTLTNWLWSALADKFGLGDASKGNAALGSIIAAGIGAVIGGVLGGPFGAIIGAAIGLLIGGVVGLFWEKFKGIWSVRDNRHAAGIGSAIGMAIGTVIGGLLGGPAGAVIGGYVGLLVGGIVGLFWNTLKEAFSKNDKVRNAGVGAALGAALGALLGGPIGAAIGAALGSIGGYLMEGIVNGISKAASKISNALYTILVLPIINGIKKLFGISSPATTMIPIGIALVDGIRQGIQESTGALSGYISGLLDAIVSGFTVWLDNIFTAFTTFWTSMYDETKTKLSDIWTEANNWFSQIRTTITQFISDSTTDIHTGFTNSVTVVTESFKAMWTAANLWFGNIRQTISNYVQSASTDVANKFDDIYTNATTKISTMSSEVSKGLEGLYGNFKDWIKDMWRNVFEKFFNWIDDAILALKALFSIKGSMSFKGTSTGGQLPGRATGGVFNREHIARFAEGNKTEAIIPLENNSAMQPFVDAVSVGLHNSLAPLVAAVNGGQGQTLVVGTLIADNHGLRELERKMRIIRLQENNRMGADM